MNNRTVRLLRKYAVVKNQSAKDAKRWWNQCPKPLRSDARKVMEAETE